MKAQNGRALVLAHGHERGISANSNSPRTVRDQEGDAGCPCPRTFHVHIQSASAVACINRLGSDVCRFHESSRLASATVRHCPQTVHSPGFAISTNPVTQLTFRGRQMSANCPLRGIVVSIWWPERIRVHSHIISWYVLVGFSHYSQHGHDMTAAWPQSLKAPVAPSVQTDSGHGIAMRPRSIMWRRRSRQ